MKGRTVTERNMTRLRGTEVAKSRNGTGTYFKSEPKKTLFLLDCIEVMIEGFIMAKHVISLTLSILLMILSIVETSDSLFDSTAFLPTFDAELPDNLFTEDDGEPVNSFTGTFASAQDECISNSDVDNLFLSSGTARLRPREDACSPPLPPLLNIYDSNEILNQFAPETLPKPDITIPGTREDKNKDVLRLKKMFDLPDFTHDTDPTEQDDVCPKELVGDSQIPVCDSGNTRRDKLRLPREDHCTLYNVRYCMSQDLL